MINILGALYGSMFLGIWETRPT